jgi:predicted HTH transcriptional regulator
LKQGRLDFPRGIYWCLRHGETPHPHVEALARRIGSNLTFISIDGFDELFGDLAQELADYDHFREAGAPQPAVPALRSFDERVIDEASLDDLDLDLALSVLTDYCKKLKRAPVTRETLFSLMREQGLLLPLDDADKVTAGALLLFGKSPHEFFPHAVVTLTEGGKKRELYEGNLISQHRRLLERFDAEEVNPMLRVKGRRQHGEQRAYPPRALVELLVNMLVHRDYALTEPATIDIRPSAEIVFANPGALPHRIAGRVALETDGRFVLSESITEQRNPALCDIFFGISAMERAGTGLIDVGRMMTESGGASAQMPRYKRVDFKTATHISYRFLEKLFVYKAMAKATDGETALFGTR